MTISPFSSSGSREFITSSTGLPAGTSIIIRRGFSNARTISARVLKPFTVVPGVAEDSSVVVFDRVQIKAGHGKAMIGHVEQQVAAHHAKAYHSKFKSSVCHGANLGIL